MNNEEQIIQKLNSIETMLLEQTLLKKEVLNFSEACHYLAVSQSHLYKLTSSKQVPHFCPQGKKLYFNRQELDEWLQRNKNVTTDFIEKAATDYILKNKHK
jgi:excisionase family DNA binding protein